MMGRTMPMRSGAAMQSQIATVTRFVKRSDSVRRASTSAIGPSVIGRQLRLRRRVPTRPVAVIAKVIGEPMSQSQGRYSTAVVRKAVAGDWGLGAEDDGMAIAFWLARWGLSFGCSG